MNMNIKRFMRLIKNDCSMQLRTTQMTLLGVGLFLLVFEKYHSVSLYTILLYTLGCALTSYIFSDVHDKHNAYRYLMLPASNLEKFLSRWLLTSVFYVLGFTAFIYVLSCFGELIFNGHFSLGIGNISGDIWEANLGYLFFQPIILLGAIYFKDRVLLKTGLVMSLFFTVLLVASAVGLYFFPFDTISASQIEFFENNLHQYAALFNYSYYIFWCFVTPACLFSAYACFRKHEI
jgi:hypothetical protein